MPKNDDIVLVVISASVTVREEDVDAFTAEIERVMDFYNMEKENTVKQTVKMSGTYDDFDSLMKRMMGRA